MFCLDKAFCRLRIFVFVSWFVFGVVGLILVWILGFSVRFCVFRFGEVVG